jgi:hypothetical protein
MEENIQRRFDDSMWNIYRRALDDARYSKIGTTDKTQ